MNMGKRIAEKLSSLGWKRQDLLDRVPDLTAQALSNLIRRDSKRSEWDETIADALGVSILWLVYGKNGGEYTYATTSDTNKSPLIAQERQPDKLCFFPERRTIDHPAIAEVAKLMQEMSDDGKFILLGKAQEVSAQWPKANPAKSSQ